MGAFDMKTVVFPAQGVPMYTYEEFERARFSGGGYRQILAREEARGRGFGFAYMHAAHEIISGMQASELAVLWETQVEEDLYNPRSLDENNDSMNAQVREYVDNAMQEYLISRGGVIDCWPAPVVDARDRSDRSKPLTDIEFLYDVFDYFQPRMFYKTLRTEGKAAAGPVYQCAYDQKKWEKRDERLAAFENRLIELRRVPQYSRKEARKNNFLFSVAMAPLVLALIVAVLYLVWYFTGVQPRLLVEEMAGKIEQSAVSAVLYIMPTFLFGVVSVFYPFLAAIAPVFYVSLVVLVGAGALASMMLVDKWKVKRVGKKRLRQSADAQREIDEIERNPQYLRLQSERKESVSQGNGLAHAWHKAWFEHCKKYYYT